MVSEKTVKVRRGFTLVELLVVIAVISILAMLLFPAMQKAKDMAKKVACMNNLKQLGVGTMQYAGTHMKYLPPGGGGDWEYDGNGAYEWQDALAEYMGLDLSWSIRFTDNWGVGVGTDLLYCPGAITPKIRESGYRTQTYMMPAKRHSGTNSVTGLAYIAARGYVVDGVQDVTWCRKLATVKAPSSTMLLSESDSEKPPGNTPSKLRQGGGPNTLSGVDHHTNSNGNGFNSPTSSTWTNHTLALHGGKIGYLFVDGHVSSYHPQSSDVVGENGTYDLPEGFWTVDPDD